MKAYLDKWREWDFHCKKCGWSGKGSLLEASEMNAYGCAHDCPSCHQYIAWEEFPLIDEMLANFDKLSPEEQKLAIGMKKLSNRWEVSKLHTVEQLPEIDAPYIVLLWDEDHERHEIVIRHGKDEIFRQPSSYEYYDFFIEACRVLKTKYGTRLLDVVPAPRTYLNLWGDRLSAPDFTDKMRKLIGRDNGFMINPHETEKEQAYREEWKAYRAGM